MDILSLARVAVGAAVAIAAVLVQRATGRIYEAPAMEGKTVLITGGNTGLGLESAKRLAKAGAKIIITVRSEEKGEKAVRSIQEYSHPGSSEVSFKVLQLDDLESTKAAAQWDLPVIDVLMLNAGVVGPSLKMTHLGLEKQMHTNHLGHFVFTASIRPFLSPNARIVVVSSGAHRIPRVFGGLDLDYAWRPTPKSYMALKSYGMSKLANVYFAAKLNALSGYTVVSVHPGEVSTDIARELTSSKPLQNLIDNTIKPLAASLGIILTVERGANTQVYLASTQDPIVGGGYYEGMTHKKLGSFATDPVKADELWKQSEELSGVKFAF